MLLFNGNPYQHHVYLTSANSMASSVYETASGVSSYFNLRDINEDLNRRNADLELEVIGLRERLKSLEEQLQADTMSTFPVLRHYEFIVAHVINNSIARPYNYITINKGEEDGIKPEMGVIDQNGVVGIVNVTGKHSSRIISLLNPNFRLSCKIMGSDNFGSLVWDGEDPSVALLEELPRHTIYSEGDTVITSGYSAVFPEGIPVGVILDDNKNHNENFFTLRIRLLSDFTTLSNVQVVVNSLKDELNGLSEGEITESPKN